jgi:hypothetical protein
VRVDPSTGGDLGYVFFDIGAISDRLQIKNTLWHQFGDVGGNQTKYRDLGTSSRLSNAYETTIAGPSSLALTQLINNDVSLPYLPDYGPVAPFTDEVGTLFKFTTTLNCSMGGLMGGYGACFSTEIYTQRCHWFPCLLA